MESLRILITSPDAESVAEDLRRGLSQTGDISVRKLSSRGADILVIIELVAASINIASLAKEVIERWQKQPTRNIVIQVGKQKFPIQNNDVKKLSALLEAAHK